MDELLVGGALVLLLSLVAGLARVLAGPTRADRMVAAQLVGTTGVGILILLSSALETAGLLDVALALSLLAGITAVAFVRWAWHAPDR